MEFWIARDRDGMLCLFEEKPELVRGAFFIAQNFTRSMMMDYKMFPEITCSNSPQKVELTLKNKKVCQD